MRAVKVADALDRLRHRVPACTIRSVLRTTTACIRSVSGCRAVGLALLSVAAMACVPSVAASAVEVFGGAPLASPSQGSAAAANPVHLISRYVDVPPVIDGRVEAAWQVARPLQTRLTWGIHSSEHAFDVRLQSVYTDDRVHFLATWPGRAPTCEENVISNRFTLHWQIPEPESLHLDCDVSCHTAYSDGSGRFAYANAETIPQGGSEALPVAGGWGNGLWTLEWSSPLRSSNPFDLQFSEMDCVVPFRIKVFERADGWADPISGRHFLVFEP